MLHAIRAIFVVICFFLGGQIGVEIYRIPWFFGASFGAGVGITCALLELAYARRFVSVISVVMFGLVVGFVVSFFLRGALDLAGLGPSGHDPRAELYRNLGITFVSCFLSVVAILHAKDDFKFVIPFVELKREGRIQKSLILDTSVIIDGRIADIIETGIVDSPLVVPKFVLAELQQVADSGDRLKRVRGRRGLDILNRMRKSPKARIDVQDVLLPEIEGVDAKLVKLAKLIDGRLVTNDFNLNKVAQVQGVEVININDLATGLRPVVLQGEKLVIKISRKGDQPGQGVGYLEDGTMVVAEECADRVGQEVELVVTNIVQTSAGRLIFGRPGTSEPTPPQPAVPARH